MLSAELLSEIVAAYKNSKTLHNRRAPRVHAGGKTTIYRLARNPHEAALEVQMREMSARGCSFTVTQKLERDSNFVLRFSRRGREPVSMLCTVMHCRAVGGQYRVGAEFTCQVDVHRAAGAAAAQSDDELARIRSSILD